MSEPAANVAPRLRRLRADNPGYSAAKNAKWNLANPEKRRAHKTLEYAVKIGRVGRRCCERCGADKAQAHHDDYSKPLEVMWLCQPHHIANAIGNWKRPLVRKGISLRTSWTILPNKLAAASAPCKGSGPFGTVPECPGRRYWPISPSQRMILMAFDDDTWTDDRLDHLEKLWPTGMSTAKIGRELGVSKNAVVGKAHRLGLHRPSPLKPASDASRRKRIRRAPKTTLPPLQPAPPPPAPVIAVAPPPRPKPPPTPLSTKHKCQWPIGNPGTSSFRLCEEPAVAGMPYCETHAELAYPFFKERRRARLAEHA